MPWELISRIDRSGYETPADVVLSLEPSVEQIKALTDRDARRRGLSALSGAYVSLGRYQDAVTLLTTSIEQDRAYAGTAESYMRADVFSGMCGLAAELCQHHLEWGYADQARAVASMAADQNQDCTNVQYAAFTCLQVAEARLGRAEQALTELEARTWGDGNVSLFGAARAEILGVLGRWDAAYEAARGTCVGPLGAGNCPGTFAQALEAMANGGTTLAQHDVMFESVRQSYPGAGSTGRVEDSVASTAAIGDCARRVRIAPTDAATLTACVAARDVSVALHGTAHARTARAWMLLGAAHAAARDATSAAAAQQEVDALRPSLGPQHVTNLPPPATPGRGRPRPRAR
jgi:tetratricopeptide (TPR) repeat protein